MLRLPAALVFGTSLLITAGCALPGEREEASSRPDLAKNSCNASSFKDTIGAPVSDIPAERFPELYRILGPNDMATMDYRLERLNMLTDANGIVIDIECG